MRLSNSAAPAIQTGWNPALFTKIKQRQDGLRITDGDRGWYEAHRNVKWYWTGPQNDPTAYAAIGRGIDLPDLVHEWGGETSELVELLAQLSQKYPKAQILGSPETFSKVSFQYDPSAVEYLCLANILDPLVIFWSYVPVSKAKDFEARFEDGVLKLEVEDRFGKASAGELDVQDVSRFFFGPKEAGAPTLGKPWSNFFPLPLWFWGLDAV